jgi:hypothetical protein
VGPRAGLDDIKILDLSGTRTKTPRSSSLSLVAVPTDYFSENLVTPGIEPGTSGSVATTTQRH